MDEPMTQFRAIPIEWGLSDDKYYKFLMWVSFKATFKGWLRCDALQVTFTMREAASKFQVSTSTISVWVNRAKSTGLLLPTNKSSREHGMGEVYNLGGEMLMTVKTTERQPNADRTPAEQPIYSEETTCDTSENVDRTPTERQPNVNKEYSPTPSPTTTSPSRARKPAGKKGELEPIPTDLLPVVDYLTSNWPLTSYGNKDDKRTVATYSPEDLWARVSMLAQKGKKVPGAILFCGLPYLRRVLKDAEESGRARFVKDMSNFWGIKEGNRMWEDVYNQGLIDYNKFLSQHEVKNVQA